MLSKTGGVSSCRFWSPASLSLKTLLKTLALAAVSGYAFYYSSLVLARSFLGILLTQQISL